MFIFVRLNLRLNDVLFSFLPLMKAYVIHVSIEKWRYDVAFVDFCTHAGESVMNCDNVISFP